VVTVKTHQASLARGRRDENWELVSRLTAWLIEIEEQ
jgi:transcription antitermination factor NusA-like protein